MTSDVVVRTTVRLTTTLVGILAEREIAVTALEATIFALGIHEDTGSLTCTVDDAARCRCLSWCLRHGARQALLESYLHATLRGGAELLDALIDGLETRMSWEA